MRSLCFFVVALTTLVACQAVPPPSHRTAVPPAPGTAQGIADGTVLAREPFRLTGRYEDLDELARFRFPRELYDAAVAAEDYEAFRIVYASGGYRVVGYEVRPRAGAVAPRPAILFCRGGTSDFGAIDATELVTFQQWVAGGYVVLATNYRGGGGSEGVDTWCGDDVDDVLNLVPLARELGGVDLDNLFLIGQSRGGPMVYRALRRKAPVRAAVVLSGVSDLRAHDMRRPEFVDGNDDEFRRIGWPGWRSVWPDYDRRVEEHLADRSAVLWADELDVPILLLHARDDHRVPADHALAMANALQAAGKEYELVVYAHDGHSLPLNRADRDARILAWCASHTSEP